MELSTLFEKGSIGGYIGNLKTKLSPENIGQFYSIVSGRFGEIKNGSCLEICHEFSNFFDVTGGSFKELTVLCDDPFESLLAFNNAERKNLAINVMNYGFNPNSLSGLGINEKYDLVVSLFGLSYDNLGSILQELIGFLKVNAVLAILIPSYWFDRTTLNDVETKILAYSKQNDKKWIFTEDINPKITECGASLAGIVRIPFTVKINRLELAYISSLTKLYDSIIKNNIAHLEITDIPEDNIEIGSSALLIQKTKKTITKDNLFGV